MVVGAVVVVDVDLVVVVVVDDGVSVGGGVIFQSWNRAKMNSFTLF